MNAERMLGSLLKGSLGRQMPGRAAIGLGVVGVAIAAFEHYAEQQRQTGALPPPAPNLPPSPPVAPPPLPAPATAANQSGGATHAGAMLLVRAMIAAASADGVIDERERARILAREEMGGLDAAERAFIEREMAAPAPLESLLAEVASPALAEELYLVSLLAIDLDTDVERAYLADLARRLVLDRDTVAKLHTVAGVPLP